MNTIKNLKIILISDIPLKKLNTIILECARMKTKSSGSCWNSEISYRILTALFKCGDPRNKSVDDKFPYFKNKSTNIFENYCSVCSHILDITKPADHSFGIKLEITNTDTKYTPKYATVCLNCNSTLIQKAVYGIDKYGNIEYKKFIRKYLFINLLCGSASDIYNRIIKIIYEEYLLQNEIRNSIKIVLDKVTYTNNTNTDVNNFMKGTVNYMANNGILGKGRI
jgi:hypothetical protein